MLIYHKRTFLSLFIYTLSVSHHSFCSLKDLFPVHKITTFFSGNSCEQVEQKKYDASSITTLVIKNNNGSTSIVTKSTSDPLHNIIFMQATKKGATKEACDTVQICTVLDHATLTITTNDTSNTHNNLVDYQFIVPLTMNLVLETEKGTIRVEDTHGTVQATNTKGTITCINNHHTIAAHVKEQGSITIEQAHKPVHAITKKGDIIINDSLHTVTAHTHKGKIIASSSLLPEDAHIHLKTDNGHINLHLPPSVQASVSAQATRGTVTSDHLITLQAQTTRLNSHAWNTFKKEVHGFLGSSTLPSSSIVLNNNRGNIKILDAVHA